MKSKIAKFLIGLSMGAMTLSACSFLPKKSSKEESLVPTSAYNNGVGQEVQPYNGNPNRTVGQIPNTPVSSYQPATMAKIASFVELIHGSASDEMVDAFANCMLAFKLGDELACAVCDFVIDSNNMSSSILDDPNYSETLVNYYYQALKILNSADFGQAANFFTELNRIYKEICTKDSSYYDTSISIIDYYSPSYGYQYLSYREYIDIKQHLSEYNNSDLDALIASYDNAYGSFQFTDAQVARYQEAMRERQQEADNMIVVPTYLISFIRNHAAASKTMLINKLKLIVDASAEFAPLVLDAVGKTSGSSSSADNYLYVSTSNGYGVSLYDYNEGSNSNRTEYTIRDYAAKFLEKRQIVLGLAKSILADEQFGDLLVDAAIEVLIPLLKDIYPDTANNRAVFSRLTTKLNSLSGKHIAALANFLLRTINQIYDDDIINFLVYYYGEGEFDGFAFGDKYIDKLTQVISGLTASDKALITELVQVLGFDLFDEISKFTKIYKEKNVSTELGEEAFYNAMSELWNQISEKMYNTIGLTYDESGSGSSSGSQKDPYAYPRVNSSLGSITQGMSQSDITSNISISYENRYYIQENGEYYETGMYFSGTYATWNERAQQAASEYNSLSDSERNSYYGYELYYRSQLTVSDFECSTVNTANCGYVDVQYSFKLNGETYTFSSTPLIIPNGGLPTIAKLYNYSNNSSKYGFNSGSAVAPDIYDINDSFSINDEVKGTTVNVTASKLGWNMYLSSNTDYYYSGYDYAAYVYYVVDPATLSNKAYRVNEEIGYYIEGESDFYQAPRIYTYYEDNGLEFYKTDVLPFEAANIGNKAPNNKYSVSYQGDRYTYIIFGQNSSEKYRYEFQLNGTISGEIKQGRSMSADVYVGTCYRLEIENSYYSIYKSQYYNNQTLTNFTYTNNVVSFKYDNQTFTFDASRLTDCLSY